MRILAIGLGGAGGRIVNHLYRTDRRSSKVACVQALAVDIDPDAMEKLADLPGNAKVCFPPVDFSRPGEEGRSQTATIDIAEIAARAQTMATGETDAVFLIMGLGGGMADDAPNIITTLRSSMTEPIFALVTLPCLSEGARCSAKAADQIEMIAPLADGVILFDNETWHKKVKIAEKMQRSSEQQGFASRLGFGKKKETAVSPAERMHAHLNDVIIRRVSLILRAGEFRADGGLDYAEVVLDSGEVLNTMKGMGFITIGYAVEQLPAHPLDFLAKLRPGTGYFADEHQKKASRIIDLAKQAIYHEISAPCDITSAHKALVLIAGPSHELSMKGFMTVRKWIDRSIAGLETRSGDYPVMSTRFVAIIIMLSGLENVPRITELREIRAEARGRISDVFPESRPEEGIPAATVSRNALRDEMITLPQDKISPGIRPSREPKTVAGPAITVSYEPPAPVTPPRPIRKEEPVKEVRPAEPEPARRSEIPADSIKKLLKLRVVPRKPAGPGGAPAERDAAAEQERRKIEEELYRQRQMALGGARKQEPSPEEPPVTREEPQPPRVRVVDRDTPAKHVLIKKPAGKKVVIHKKSSQADREAEAGPQQDTGVPPEKTPADSQEQDLLDDWIRQVKDQRQSSRGESETRTVDIDEAPGAVTRDDALIRTRKKRMNMEPEEQNRLTGIRKIEPVREIEPAGKKRNRIKEDEDLSFVE